MTDAVTYLSVLELVIGGLCLAIAGLAWGYRDRPAGTPLAVLAVAAAGWAVAAGVDSLVADPGVTRAVQFLVYVFSGVATVAWFFAVLEHTGSEGRERRSVAVVTGGLVAVDLLSVATDPWHHLYITAGSSVGPAGLFDPTPGPLLWANAVWKSGVVLVGLALLLREYASRRGVFSLQTASLAVAGVVAPAFAVAELLDVVPVPGFDLGVLGIATSAIILLWALFYANLLSVAPIARRTLFENMEDAVVALDAQGNVVDLNRRAMALFDVGSGAIGRPAAQVFADHPELAPADLLSGAAPPGDLTAEVDGERRHFELSTSPVVGPSAGAAGREGERVGTLLVFRDVTLRRERERDVERKNARLEEFASVVSHDLRSPLSVATGYLELGRETGDDAHLEEVAVAHGRMESLIQDLLVLAREGKEVGEREPVDLAALASSCWRNVVSDGAALSVETAATVSADRSRLEQLVENLLRNALEHGSTSPDSRARRDALEHGSTSPGSHARQDAVEHGSTSPDSRARRDAVEHGGESVTVTVGDLEDGAGFFVADDGPGIPADLRERVFEHGYSSNERGTGLGLGIVREIADAHGWTVSATESEHGGARFEFVGVETDAGAETAE